MNKFRDPLKEQRALIASIADPLKEHRALMASMVDPLKEQRALIASIAEPLKGFRASIASIPELLKDFNKSIDNSYSLQYLTDIAKTVTSDIKIYDNGTVCLSSTQISVAEIQELSNQIIYNSSLASSSSLEESINNLIIEIRSQKDPLIQKILIYFIYPLIILIIGSFINPIADYYVKSYLAADKRTISKDIKTKVTRSITNRDALSIFRYVSTDVLNVRVSSYRKSKTIGYLQFGYAVMVVEKRKSWTLIEWSDPESGVNITGWVFSRYLKKFN